LWTLEPPPLPIGTPAAEHAIDGALVAGLLADQHPDLAQEPLLEAEAGWDNAMFRLGEHLAVRLPRRAAAAALITHEQAWLPRLADRLTLPVPAPCRMGTPALGYPWRWSVLPWLPGTAADLCAPQASQARPFASFLRSLHVPAPAEAPHNPMRGVPLSQRASAFALRVQRLAGRTGLVTPRIVETWEAALRAPIDGPSTWLHGDLHPRNVLVDGGALTGIIDWGDLTAGDPATDLASIWMLFDDPRARQEVLDTYGPVSKATLRRARGWAVMFGVMLLDTGLTDHPRHAAIGERTLRRLDGAP
jgi:aminoglycoside phosphotransferase (APT) family kinase protein